MRTHYDNLKVARNAPKEVITAAYRALSKKYHPDLNSDPDATRVMSIINVAYEVLSDPSKRVEYDALIRQEELENKEAEANPPPPSQTQNQAESSRNNSQKEYPKTAEKGEDQNVKSSTSRWSFSKILVIFIGINCLASLVHKDHAYFVFIVLILAGYYIADKKFPKPVKVDFGVGFGLLVAMFMGLIVSPFESLPFLNKYFTLFLCVILSGAIFVSWKKIRVSCKKIPDTIIDDFRSGFYIFVGVLPLAVLTTINIYFIVFPSLFLFVMLLGISRKLLGVVQSIKQGFNFNDNAKTMISLFAFSWPIIPYYTFILFALFNNPDNIQIDQIYDMGNLKYRQGNYKAAIAKYKEIVRLRQDDPLVHFNLSLTYDQMKNGSSAINEMSKAVELYEKEGNAKKAFELKNRLQEINAKYGDSPRGLSNIKVSEQKRN